MNRSQRMKPVQRVAERREETAAKELGDAQNYLKQQQERLTELRSYHAEYVRNFETLGSNGIGVVQFHQYQQFLASLGKAIEQQGRMVEQATQVCEQKRRQWQVARGKSKSLDKVVERMASEERYHEGRREQLESDEMAQHRRGRGSPEDSE